MGNTVIDFTDKVLTIDVEDTEKTTTTGFIKR